ncbi:MAG: hypothetical protein DWQ46_02860 [Planctomycetota bacterium]|nr:MAG: hypothetical protein DWQ46_02860 [Planctomycetota bacterium]
MENGPGADEHAAEEAAAEREATDATETAAEESWLKRTGVPLVIFVASVAMIGASIYSYFNRDISAPVAQADGKRDGRSFLSVVDPMKPDRLVIKYWDVIPTDVIRTGLNPGNYENIRPVDYFGSDNCKSCHEEIYGDWAGTYHRHTNHQPEDTTVKGDFSATASLDYLGGKATFYRETIDDREEFRMRLERGDVTRVYKVTGTVGGRSVQGYSGTLLEGPEPEDHPSRHPDGHVHLPFEYSLKRGQWSLPVHSLGGAVELTDQERADPFDENGYVVGFNKACGVCHTSRFFGDWLIADSGTSRMLHHGLHEDRRQLAFLLGPYLQDNRPDLVDPAERLLDVADGRIESLLAEMDNVPVGYGAISRGVACEACHYGCRQHSLKHSQGEKLATRYFASSTYAVLLNTEAEVAWGKNAANLNFMCARCHSDVRPRFASGASTWHGAASSDADRGSCYHPAGSNLGPKNQLTCIHCHDPHADSAQTWTATPQQEDARCVACHTEYENENVIREHTHHELNTAGSRCMNCHMPKIVEGRHGVLRTHMISSPTDKRMLEQNQVNACNLCHLDQSIDWTLDQLRKWYPTAVAVAAPGEAGAEGEAGEFVSEVRLAENYPQRDGKVGLGWLRGRHAPTRLAATAALAEADARWALDDLLARLDDEMLANRKIAQLSLEKMLDLKLADFGYDYLQTPTERREPIKRVRDQVLATAADAEANGATPGEAAATEPAPSEPAEQVPAESDPTPSDPTPSEPAPSEPAPSEPAPSEPAPSEPTEAE